MRNILLEGDVSEQLATVPEGVAQCSVTSPPYWGLRDYGHRKWIGGDSTCTHPELHEHAPLHKGQVEQTKWARAEGAGKGQNATTHTCVRCGAWYGQIGLEPTPEAYVTHLVEIFREVRRVLREDGTLWLNLGDSYVHRGQGLLKTKDLIGIPWMVAFALRADGWFLRSDVIWSKGNPLPESVEDRPTRSHEYLFLLTKAAKYYYDAEAIKEPLSGQEAEAGGRNRRTVWPINTKPYKGAHFATFPEELPRTCILASTRSGDLVLDPFAGSGTTLAVAKYLQRDYLGVELNPTYATLARERIKPAEAWAELRASFQLMEKMDQDI